jgi:hypothetical protein
MSSDALTSPSLSLSREHSLATMEASRGGSPPAELGESKKGDGPSSTSSIVVSSFESGCLIGEEIPKFAAPSKTEEAMLESRDCS